MNPRSDSSLPQPSLPQTPQLQHQFLAIVASVQSVRVADHGCKEPVGRDHPTPKHGTDCEKRGQKVYDDQHAGAELNRFRRREDASELEIQWRAEEGDNLFSQSRTFGAETEWLE